MPRGPLKNVVEIDSNGITCFMKNRHITQEEMAKSIGIGTRTLTRALKTGKMKKQYAVRIQELYGNCDLDFRIEYVERDLKKILKLLGEAKTRKDYTAILLKINRCANDLNSALLRQHVFQGMLNEQTSQD